MTPEEAAPFLERMAERRFVDLGLLSFLGVKLPWIEGQAKRELPMRREEVVIGGYCKGQCVEECRALFGEALWQACRTCPN